MTTMLLVGPPYINAHLRTGAGGRGNRYHTKSVEGVGNGNACRNVHVTKKTVVYQYCTSAFIHSMLLI